MNIRDRIKELRRVRAGDLRPHPKNWRKHPEEQANALRGILAEVGFVDALMVRELPDGALQIVDGHLRAETTPDAEVPVLVVDLDDKEAEKVLATFDPLGAIAEPDEQQLAALLEGIETDSKPIEYCICQRGKTTDAGSNATFSFERIVPARNFYHFGYFDRFDQVRGISPLATAVNALRDTYEGMDYALAKMKVSQLFGLIFFRDRLSPDEQGNDTLGQTSANEDDGTGYEVDFGRGPVQLDLDPGDRAEFLESKSPSTEFQSFSQVMVSVALKALDIPYSFYAENFTNYSGARQALLQYEQSVVIKRLDLQAMLDHLTCWRIALWIQDGVLPGVSLSDIRWEWIPAGIPWIDPLKEINADIAAIGACLSSRTRRLREQGLDFYDVADELAAESRLAGVRGYYSRHGQSGVFLDGVLTEREYEVVDEQGIVTTFKSFDWVFRACDLAELLPPELGDQWEVSLSDCADVAEREYFGRPFEAMEIGQRPCFKPHDLHGVMLVVHMKRVPSG